MPAPPPRPTRSVSSALASTADTDSIEDVPPINEESDDLGVDVELDDGGDGTSAVRTLAVEESDGGSPKGHESPPLPVEPTGQGLSPRAAEVTSRAPDVVVRPGVPRPSEVTARPPEVAARAAASRAPEVTARPPEVAARAAASRAPEVTARPPEVAARAAASRAPDLPARRAEAQPIASAAVLPPAELRGREERAQWVIHACDRALSALDGGRKPELAGRLSYEIGRQYEHPLGNLVRASEAYGRALSLRPEHVPSLQGGRRVALRQNNPAQALPLFDAEVRLAPDAGHRGNLLVEKAECLYAMGRDGEAEKTLAQAGELLAGSVLVQTLVVLAERRAGNHAVADRALGNLVESVTQDMRHRAVLLAARARMADVAQRDPKGAIELYRAALTADQYAPGVLSALSRLYYGEGRWGELVEVLVLRAAQASRPDLRGIYHQSAARICLDRLHRVEDGMAALERALADLPDDVGILTELELGYERLGRGADQARILERLVALCPEPRACAGMAYRLGRLYDVSLGDPARAVEWYTRELLREPGHAQSLGALAALYEKHGQWQALVDMRKREAESCQEGLRRAGTFARVAELLERRLGNPQDAIAMHQRALAAEPGYSPSFLALERLLREASRHADLAELYARAAERERDDEARVALFFKLGRLYEEELRDPAAAVGAYERVTGLVNPQVEAIHAVGRAAERGGLWAQLVASLDQEATVTKDPIRRAGLLHRAAEVLAEHLDDVDGSAARWRKVLEMDAKHEPALLGLGALLSRAGRWEEWLGVEKRRLATLPVNGTPRADVHFAMGVVLEEQLGRRSDAILAHREAIAVNPDHLLAHAALGRLLALEERWAELVEVLERASSGAGVLPLAAAARLTWAGELLEHRLGKPEAALAVYDKALLIVRGHRMAMDGRLRLLAQSRASKALAEAWASRVAEDAGIPEVQSDAFEEAEVRRDELGQTDKACEILEGIVTRDPGHLAALVAIEELSMASGALANAARALSLMVRALAEPSARAAALNRLGLVLGRLGVPEQQLSALVGVLEIEPQNRLALGQLERLALATGNHALLAQVDSRLIPLMTEPKLAAMHQTRLAEALEDSRDPAALGGYAAALGWDREDVAAVRGLGRMASSAEAVTELEIAADAELATTGDVDVCAGWLLRASEIYEARGDSVHALRLVHKSLSVHPDHVASAERLVELRMIGDQVDALVGELSQVAGRARSRERAGALWTKAARLLADVQHDVPGAIAMLGRVTNTIADNAAVWFELGELYVRDGQGAAAVERYRRVLELEAERELSLAARMALGALLIDLGQPAQALTHLETVLAQKPGDVRALRGLLAVRLHRGEIDAAAHLAGQMVETATTAQERADALLGLGRVELKRGNAVHAERAFEQAVVLAGLEGGAASELVEMVRPRAGEEGPAVWVGYAEALRTFVESGGGASAPVGRAAAELARVLDQELGQVERAIPMLERALSLSPEEPELLSALAQARSRAGQWGGAMEAYRRLLGRQVGRVEAYRGIAHAFECLDRRADAITSAAPIVVLGQATDLETAAVSARLPNSGPLPPRSLDAEAFVAVGGPSPTDAMGALIAAMSEGLSRVQDTELERYGLSARDRVGSRSGHPVRAVADRIGQAFGAEEFDLYVAGQGTSVVMLECGDPPSVIVPTYLMQAPEPIQIFALARVLAPFSLKWGGVEMLDAHSLQLWVRAALRLGDSNYGVGGREDEVISVLASRLTKALPWRRKGKVEEAAQVCLATGRVAVDDFRGRVRMAAARLAVVLADDLPSVARFVRQTTPDPSLLPGAAGAGGASVLDEILRGWVSEGAFSIRRRLGIG